MIHAKAAILNLIPGFGLGYLLLERQGAFKKTFSVWVTLITIFTLIDASWSDEFRIHGYAILYSYYLGIVLVGIPSAIHTLISATLGDELRWSSIALLIGWIIIGITVGSLLGSVLGTSLPLLWEEWALGAVIGAFSGLFFLRRRER